MKCPACQRANLPGGVRCVYCGTAFPPTVDFDLGPEPERPAPAAAPAPEPRKPVNVGRVLLFLGIGALSVFKLGKLATVLGSMAVFVAALSPFLTWKLALGLAGVILIHELGHVFVNWRKGLKQTAPMFIPFLGAVIFVRQFPDDPTVQSESGAGGPAAGLLASLACVGLAALTGDPFWQALAFLSFAINLVNLLPLPPLDGSHVASVFSPRLWDAVLAALLLWVIKVPNLVLWGVLVVGFLFRLGRTEWGRHQLAPPAVRVRMAAVYVFLCVTLATGMQLTLPAGALPDQAAVSAAAEAAAAETQPRPPGEDPEVSPLTQEEWDRFAAFMKVAVPLASAFLLLCVVAIWFLTALLLAVAAGERFDRRALGLAAGMSVAAVVLAGALAFKEAFYLEVAIGGWAIIGAAVAATAAGFLFAGWQALTHRSAPERPSRAELTWRCLGWAAGGALIVAYWAENPWVALLIALGALLFYLPRRWLLLGLAANFWEGAGGGERALALRERALALKPEPEADLLLRLALARAYLALGRGEPALAALAGVEAGPDPPAGPRAFSLRARALLLTERYEEALRLCEELLRVPGDDRSRALRPVPVHAALAELALHRGWPDEALAQAECALRAVPPTAAGFWRELVGHARVVRAEALAALGRAEAARLAAGRALEWGGGPEVEDAVALVRARLALETGDLPAAEKESAALLLRRNGSLPARYWRAEALRAAGRRFEAETLLKALHRDFPDEHWGRQADRALLSPPRSGAA